MTPQDRIATSDLLASPNDFTNITDLITARTERAPKHPAFRVRRAGSWVEITTSEFQEDITTLAKSLIAEGVAAGDRILIQGPTSYEWAVADLAVAWVGGVVIPLFETASDQQISRIVQAEQPRWGFANASSFDRLTNLAGPNVTIWPLEKSGTRGEAAEISDAELEQRRTQTQLDDVATVVYTSGTEGRPKGVLITHRNLVGQVINIEIDYRAVVNERGSTLIFLPLSHVLARGLQLICLAVGMTISYESDPKAAIESLGQVRPTFLVVVPRVLQKVRDQISQTASQKRLGWAWRSAEATAIAWGEHLENQQDSPSRAPAALRIKRTFFDLLFFRKVRGLFGGRIEYLLCGAAPLGRELGLLFRGMGLETIEGYGLTETTAPVTGNRPGDNYCGTVGRPEPGHTIKIAPDGEVLAKGVGVSPGYRDARDNETAFVDGYLRTGDLGTLDEGGRLTITGRKKDVIVTSGGKTISPQDWQSEVELNPHVAHAVVVGDSRPFPAALILVDAAEAGVDLPPGDNGFSEITTESILESIGASLAHANSHVSKPEMVKRFQVLAADLTVGGELITPTMKLRRSALLTKLTSYIDSIYLNGRAV